MVAYLWIFLVLVCFGLFHTFSAKETVRSTVLGKLKISSRSYLGFRAIISFTLLIVSLVTLFHLTESTQVFFQPIQGVPAMIPALLALWIAGSALRQVAKAGRIPQFFGFQEFPKLFIYSGVYTFSRHPMYSGWLIAGWGLMIGKPYSLTLFYNLLLTVLIILIARQEEQRMLTLFGEKYATYRHQTPFLIPYGFLKKQQPLH